MNCRVDVTPGARKEILALPSGPRARITAAVDALGAHPRPHGVTKLRGEDGVYRIRVGDYRVLYAIDDAVHVVGVFRVADRKEVYQLRRFALIEGNDLCVSKPRQ